MELQITSPLLARAIFYTPEHGNLGKFLGSLPKGTNVSRLACYSVGGFIRYFLILMPVGFQQRIGHSPLLNSSGLTSSRPDAHQIRRHSQEQKLEIGFAWQYLPGSDLKQSLAYPGGAVAEWVYEPRRDLLTLVSNDVFSAYAYENDAAGRRVSKNTEHYGYNVRGELIAATNTAPVAHYAYTFDDIGNRVVADELGTNIAYTANALNQYTNIVSTDEFLPEFDDDGNQTLVKTSTGVWHVTYNAENRPVVWSNETAVVTMDYDFMGRRVWYASVSGGQTNAFSKFVYDGYLCVQQLDGFTGSVEQEFVWDPTERIATRPLSWTQPGLDRTFHYFQDGNKNVTDVVDASDGSLVAHYNYAPFGAVTTATGPMAQPNPYRFSSEYHDPALGCVYYNYRHYNPLDGRWMNRDPIEEEGDVALYVFGRNSTINKYDYLGLVQTYNPEKLKCCTLGKVTEGENLLVSTYNDIYDTMEGENIPHHGSGEESSCAAVSISVLNRLNGKVPPCWSCDIVRRTSQPFGYIWRDHWVVICSAYGYRGRFLKEILFDYWKPRPAGESPHTWFYLQYPHLDPDNPPSAVPPVNCCPEEEKN